MNNKEIWKIIPKFEKHEASSFGRIRNFQTKRVLKPYLNKYGYHIHCLYYNKKLVYKKVHRLVAYAFIKNPKNKEYINHKDGNKLNNNISNLEWSTAKENAIHCSKMKLQIYKKGEDHGRVKLNEKQVKEIRKLYKNSKFHQREIAVRFNITQTLVSKIVRRVLWTHI